MANGVMIVNREYPEMTPVGMKFSTLAGSVGGGLQTPGFVGHSKHYIGSKKFLLAEGGLKRLAWMPKMLKEEIKHLIEKRGKELGLENFIDMIADEDSAQTEEEVMEFMQKVNHPALTLDPMI
jgi:acetyl-CoA synthase